MIRRSVFAGIRVVLAHPGLLSLGIELAGLAVREFFLPQFETRLFPGRRRVLAIRHPLDPRIPFQPRRIRRYLGFIGIWMGSLGALWRCFGRPALPEIARSIRGLCRLYRSTGSVYRRHQSTTERPRAPRLSLRFLLVRLFDPHLHCIPSLHVLILCYNSLHLRLAAERLVGPAGYALASEARREALSVIRSVLLVKQHSLADIGPSLYMLRELCPEYGLTEAEEFVRDLFREFPGASSELCGALRQAVMADFRDMQRLRRRNPGKGIEDLVVSYLESWRQRPSPGRRSN